MKFDKRHKNTFLSIVIFAVLTAIVFLINWQTDFAGFGIWFATEFVAVVAGLIVILIRAFRHKVNKESLIYNYIGVLNLILGFIILFTSVFSSSIPGKLFLLALILNLFIGAFIFTDIFKKRK